MGNKTSYQQYNKIQPLKPEQATQFSNDITCILEPKNNKGGLYLGNVRAASNIQLLKYYNIASVLTVAVEANVHYGGKIPHHLVVLAYDIQSYDLSQYIKQSMKFLKKTLEKTNVLIHCMMGVSRSTSFVLWYLMTQKKMPLSQAFNHVKQRRPIINPNKGFIAQLTLLQTSLKQNKSQKSSPIEKQQTKKLPQNSLPNANQLRYSGVNLRYSNVQS